MSLFNRKCKDLEQRVKKLEGRLSGTNEDLRALEDNVCFSREWDCLVCFVLKEARFSDGWDRFMIPLDRHNNIYVGALKKEIEAAGFVFSRLRFRRTRDVRNLLYSVRRGTGVSAFVDEDVLRSGGEL